MRENHSEVEEEVQPRATEQSDIPIHSCVQTSYHLLSEYDRAHYTHVVQPFVVSDLVVF